MIGLIGEGLFDVNVPGEIFAAPGPDRIVEGIFEADCGAGVLLCVSHHAGDRMNAEMALELCQAQGIGPVEMVLLYDDISSAPKGQEPERRGTAGLFFTWKMLGAYAETGASLMECKPMAEQIRDNTRTLAVALTSGSNPVTGQVMFELPDDEIEIGMGVHGEVGQGRRNSLLRMASSAPCCRRCWRISHFGRRRGAGIHQQQRQPDPDGDEHSLSQCGSAPGGGGHSVYKAWLDEYATTQEMAGFALSLCRVDEPMKRLWDAPANGTHVRFVG